MKTTKPGKQRKKLYQASLSERYRRFSAPLSSKLKESHNTSSVPVRRGDTVTIMRGDRRGSEGKVQRIDRKNYRIFVEGVDREKVDGTKILIPIHPSKVMITRLNLDDKWRKKVMERKSLTEAIEEEPPKKEAKKKKKTSKKSKKSEGT
jgi:large subunit ribosomal protein L24